MWLTDLPSTAFTTEFGPWPLRLHPPPPRHLGRDLVRVQVWEVTHWCTEALEVRWTKLHGLMTPQFWGFFTLYILVQ